MSDRLTRHRWWLALAYLLSGVLVQGTHSHSGHGEIPSHDERASCSSDCGASSESDDLLLIDDTRDCEPGGCPSCQFQLTHQAALLSSASCVGFDPETLADAQLELITSAFTSRPHNRGPPLS